MALKNALVACRSRLGQWEYMEMKMEWGKKGTVGWVRYFSGEAKTYETGEVGVQLSFTRAHFKKQNYTL